MVLGLGFGGATWYHNKADPPSGKESWPPEGVANLLKAFVRQDTSSGIGLEGCLKEKAQLAIQHTCVLLLGSSWGLNRMFPPSLPQPLHTATCSQ